VLPEAYDPTWSLSARAYPDHLGWRLKHILGPPTTTAGNGVITDPDGTRSRAGAYRHVWKSTDASWGNLRRRTLAHPLTAQMIAAYKDQGVFVKLKGAACEAFAFDNRESGGVLLTANGPALFLDDGIADPALTPAFEAATTAPFMRGGLSAPDVADRVSGTKDDFGIAIAAPGRGRPRHGQRVEVGGRHGEGRRPRRLHRQRRAAPARPAGRRRAARRDRVPGQGEVAERHDHRQRLQARVLDRGRQRPVHRRRPRRAREHQADRRVVQLQADHRRRRASRPRSPSSTAPRSYV
jgi:hypothetical protein